MWGIRPKLLGACVLMALAVAFAGCGGSSAHSDEHFTRANWDQLQSDPNAHKGASVDFVGRVFTAPERDKKGTYLQVWADPKSSEQNTIVGYSDPSFKVAEDDYVHVVGTVKGKYTGKNAFGADVTVPTVVASTLKVVDATAAAPPALATLGPRTSIQAGVRVSVTKVEFAASETRVFMTVRNHTNSNVSVYANSMKAVQQGRQFDPSFSSDYPELSSDVVPGASSSGWVVFPKMSPSGGLELHLEAYSSDSNVGSYGTLKYLFSWA
jgi:hypothetical protein